jgi:hypothetical protein
MLDAAMESGSENDVATIVKYAKLRRPGSAEAGEDRVRLAQAPPDEEGAAASCARPISSIW